MGFGMQGGAIGYWKPHDLMQDPNAPTCVGCMLVNETNRAAYGSADGWATQAAFLKVHPQPAAALLQVHSQPAAALLQVHSQPAAALLQVHSQPAAALLQARPASRVPTAHFVLAFAARIVRHSEAAEPPLRTLWKLPTPLSPHIPAQVDAVQAEEGAGEEVKHNITVQIVDMNSEIVAVDYSSTVEMHFEDPGVCNVQDGSTRLQAVAGVVIFSGASSGLTLKGRPGVQCRVYFTSDMDGLYTTEVVSNVSVVPIRKCRPGEALHNNDPWQYCEACKPGWLSLDNASACVKCDQHLHCTSDDAACPLECLGGDAYVVCQGSYLAPQARHCAQDTKCLLDRVYKCEVAAACTTNNGAAVCGADEAVASGRYAQGSASVAELQVCDEEEYVGSESVLCGSNVPVGCSQDHYVSLMKDACHKCGSRVAVLFTFLAVGTVLLFLGALVLLLLTHRSQNEDFKVLQSELSSEGLLKYTQMNKARHAFSLLVGYCQVIGQLSTIFSVDLIPSDLNPFISVLSLANIDVPFMLNMECFAYYFLPLRLTATAGFMIEFWESVLLPWLLPGVFVLIYLVTTAAHQVKSQSAAMAEEPDDHAAEARNAKAARVKAAEEAELEWIRNLRASCWSASLFVMLLVHPGISATMFHLFNCQNIYFDVESLAFQYWLVVDNRQECFTTSWWVAVVFAVLTLVIFVSGFPFFLWISMRHLRRHHRLSMPRELAEQQIDHVLAGRWIPASAHDVTNVRLYQSFYVRKKASRRLSSSQYFILPRLSLQSSFLYNPDSITDDTESEPTLVDLFVPKTFFTKCAGGDDASLEKAAKALQIPASEVANWPMACSASPSDAPPTSSMGGCADRPASSILLQNGKILTGVICHDQEIAVSGQVGLVLRAPVTMLDANAKVLSQFVAPFQNDFYFWQVSAFVT
ncbi:hypothetical protein CYMTET_24796 [Cymbomonas tetramitiformis]|uniref:Uncharacterized protein n=1 Tax=Cymbomonas tetramitiformis TaxID=36881 RepID=A0AAE0FVD0_9CHLO|nr:hypothetical protein CYMTET_24796 [Cymbomonas tetramitiformis]